MATVHSAPIMDFAPGFDGSRAAVVAIRLAEIMGIFERPDRARIDRAMVGSVIAAAAEAGLAEEVAIRADSAQPSDATILALLRALENSPRPSDEIARLAGIVGYGQLSTLVGASESSLRRYTAEKRGAPDAVAARVHFVALLVAVLRGSFNEFGIRRWFDREHPDLAEHSPAQFLTGNWDPSDERPQSAAQLAIQLLW